MALILSRVAETLKGHPGDLPLILRSADTVVRTLAAEHRLSPRDEHAAAERIFNLVNQWSAELGLEPPILPPPPEEAHGPP